MHRNAQPFIAARLKQPALVGLLGVLCCAMLLALAVPSLLGRVPAADDLGAFHYPLRVFYSQQLTAGESFDWWPQIFGGTYITGEGQLGGYHPWHLALYRWLPVDAAFRLEVWSNYPVMLLGMVVLLWHWRLDRSAALFGAAAFTFGGFNLLHYVHVNAIGVVAHLPWLLWSADVVLGSDSTVRRRWARLLFSVLIASQILLGYPQYVWICLLAVSGLCGFRLYESGRSAVPRRAGWLAVAAVIGLVIGGVQLLPTYDALQHSVRTDWDAESAASGSLHPLNLLQLVAPYAFENRVVGANTHELGLYTGSATLALVVWLGCHWTLAGRLRPLAWAAVALAVLSLWMAFGEYGLLYQVQTWLPVVGKFRFPCRMIVLFQFALAVLAAIAWYCLIRQLNAPSAQAAMKTKWPAASIALLLASVAAGLLACWRWPDHAARWPLVLVGPALIALAVGLVSLAARRHVAALYALAVLAAVDWGLYGLSYAVYRQPDTIATENIPESQGRIALNSSNSQQFIGNESTLTGSRRIDGYAGLTPRQTLDYSHIAALRLAGVEWVAERREVLGASKDELQRRAGFVRIDNRLPRTWLVGEAITTTDPAKDLLTIDPRKIALVEAPLQLSGRTDGEAVIVRDRPGDVELAVRAQGDALLILTESFHSGWQANIAGRPVQAYRVYGDFIGIPVPDGVSRVELRFRPASLRYGALISACGLVLLWVSHGCSVWRNRTD